MKIQKISFKRPIVLRSALGALFTKTVFLMMMFCVSTAHATIIDFKALANTTGSLGESAWNPLMFKADGAHTQNPAEAFLTITATRGTTGAYAYMDAGNAGLGSCFTLNSSATADVPNPGSGANLCNPSSDDNITYHVPASGGAGEAESVHFAFSTGVTLDNIWLNNNHDGDKSILNDKVLVGIDGNTPVSTLITNGPAPNTGGGDSYLGPLGTLTSLTIGFDPSQIPCGPDNSNNNCELYISKLEFTEAVPEPNPLVLMSLALAGIGYRRHRVRKVA